MRESVTLFWENNHPKREVHFVEGLRSGVERFWNQKGILVDQGEYEKGKPVHLHQRWNDQGLLIEKIEYLDRDRYNLQYWDETGVLRMELKWEGLQCIEKYWDVLGNRAFERRGTWAQNSIVWEEEPARSLPSMGLPSPISQNLWELFQERFPHLALFALSWEEKEAPLESVVSCKLNDVDAVFIYGLGGGASFGRLKSWLDEDANRRLIFLEDEGGYIAHFLNTSPWGELLQRSQVSIEWIEKDLQETLEKYPMERIEVVSLPSRSGPLFESYRLQLLRQNTLSFAFHQDRMHGYHPFSHFARNLAHLPSSFYANHLQNAFHGMPAIVCGAGPSLTLAIDWLKEVSSKALIIAGGSTLAALSSKGVPIHFGMAIDPNLEEYRRLKNSFAFDTPLLFSTRVHPWVFQTCSGPFGYMRAGIGGPPEIWMEEELGLQGPLIGAELSQEALSVTTICVAFAAFLGCKSILLSGVDLAYTGGKRYAEGVGAQEECKESSHSPDRMVSRLNYEGKEVQTAIRWVMEGNALSQFAKDHPDIAFCNTGSQGLVIEGMEYLSSKEAEGRYLQSVWDVKGRVKEEVEKAKMPPLTSEIVADRFHELKESIQRVIGHLEILAEEKKGSKALAEVELTEELAHDLLFYDFPQLLSFEKENLWKRWLAIARKYAISCSYPT